MSIKGSGFVVIILLTLGGTGIAQTRGTAKAPQVSSPPTMIRRDQIPVCDPKNPPDVPGDKLYLYSVGVQIKQDGQQMCFLQMSAEKGYAPAQAILGHAYLAAKDPEGHGKAVKWLTAAADNGSAGAQDELGTMYLYGRGVSKNPDEGKRLLMLAANQGHPDAKKTLLTLGVATNKQDQVKLDQQQLFAELLKKGCMDSYANLNISYGDAFDQAQEEELHKKNFKEAVCWMTVAAKKGFSLAEYYVAEYYATGQGVTPDDRQAFQWYLKAADHYVAEAMRMVYISYDLGWGVAVNPQESRKWKIQYMRIKGAPSRMSDEEVLVSWKLDMAGGLDEINEEIDHDVRWDAFRAQQKKPDNQR